MKMTAAKCIVDGCFEEYDLTCTLSIYNAACGSESEEEWQEWVVVAVRRESAGAWRDMVLPLCRRHYEERAQDLWVQSEALSHLLSPMKENTHQGPVIHSIEGEHNYSFRAGVKKETPHLEEYAKVNVRPLLQNLTLKPVLEGTEDRRMWILGVEPFAETWMGTKTNRTNIVETREVQVAQPRLEPAPVVSHKRPRPRPRKNKRRPKKQPNYNVENPMFIKEYTVPLLDNATQPEQAVTEADALPEDLMYQLEMDENNKTYTVYQQPQQYILGNTQQYYLQEQGTTQQNYVVLPCDENGLPVPDVENANPIHIEETFVQMPFQHRENTVPEVQQDYEIRTAPKAKSSRKKRATADYVIEKTEMKSLAEYYEQVGREHVADANGHVVVTKPDKRKKNTATSSRTSYHEVMASHSRFNQSKRLEGSLGNEVVNIGNGSSQKFTLIDVPRPIEAVSFEPNQMKWETEESMEGAVEEEVVHEGTDHVLIKSEPMEGLESSPGRIRKKNKRYCSDYV